jgi:hypothetical protein
MYRGAQAVVRQAWIIVQAVKNETLFYDIQQQVEVPDVVLSGIAFRRNPVPVGRIHEDYATRP